MRGRRPAEGVDGDPAWVSGLVRSTPQAPLMAPYLAYLFLMMLDEVFPDRLLVVSYAIRTLGAFWVAWLFRRHLPPFGRPYLLIAVPAGLFAAWGWVAGQDLFDRLGLGGTLSIGSLISNEPRLLVEAGEAFDARARIGSDGAYFAHVAMKLGYTTTIVPLVEELFWRAFLLRALISWDRFDAVPLGKFGWMAFIGTALLSTLQHPANWGVSIVCWLFFNALFYWKKSIWCLIVVHGVTNLALYSYAAWTGDWRFW